MYREKMKDYSEQRCPKCGQMLRIPGNKGGITMVCPECGNMIDSVFKFGGVRRSSGKNIFVTIFELPYSIVINLVRYFSTPS